MDIQDPDFEKFRGRLLQTGIRADDLPTLSVGAILAVLETEVASIRKSGKAMPSEINHETIEEHPFLQAQREDRRQQELFISNAEKRRQELQPLHEAQTRVGDILSSLLGPTKPPNDARDEAAVRLFDAFSAFRSALEKAGKGGALEALLAKAPEIGERRWFLDAIGKCRPVREISEILYECDRSHLLNAWENLASDCWNWTGETVLKSTNLPASVTAEKPEDVPSAKQAREPFIINPATIKTIADLQSWCVEIQEWFKRKKSLLELTSLGKESLEENPAGNAEDLIRRAWGRLRQFAVEMQSIYPQEPTMTSLDDGVRHLDLIIDWCTKHPVTRKPMEAGQKAYHKHSLSVSPLGVFCAYSHANERQRKKLENHLSQLKNDGLISTWHDRKIGPGKEWESEIDRHLNSAKIILLLISHDFLASAYCYGVEMKRAMERHNAGEAVVVPVILRHCDWHSAPFGKLEALPEKGKPVTDWDTHDHGYTNVVKGIRAAVENKEGSKS